MDIVSVKPAHLSTINGKYVYMQSPERSHELVAVNRQRQGPEVKVYHIEYNKTKCMAFCFELGKKSVFPFVKDEKVDFMDVPTDKPITPGTFNQTFLFKWGERDCCGPWRSLNSVAKPNKYLSVEEKGKVTIKTEPEPSFKILYKKKEDTANRSQAYTKSGKIHENMTTRWKKNTWQMRRKCECSERNAKRMKFQ